MPRCTRNGVKGAIKKKIKLTIGRPRSLKTRRNNDNTRSVTVYMSNDILLMHETRSGHHHDTHKGNRAF